MEEKSIRKRYPKAFKEEAVALVLTQGYSIPEAAKSLGINSNMLHRWKDQILAESNGQVIPPNHPWGELGGAVFYKIGLFELKRLR